MHVDNFTSLMVTEKTYLTVQIRDKNFSNSRARKVVANVLVGWEGENTTF
jgi:hypothetical protein